ncbi:Cna B-type domain-containing protein [Clostridium perfringens]|uniref:Cna B-type domain-containing protein n=1 Tax=Clostridium perfringens TaxID=1502 RepID=UPI0024BC15FD|nr:Cna B-type domain-containing protein [Clostridium perfringens]
MQKKLSTYIILFVMITSFLITPLKVFAEPVNNNTHQTQTKIIKNENDNKLNSFYQESITKKNEKKQPNKSEIFENTQTNQKQQSKAIQLNDQQEQTKSTQPEAIKSVDNKIDSSYQDNITKENKKETPIKSDALEHNQTNQNQQSEASHLSNQHKIGITSNNNDYTKLTLTLDPPRADNKYFTGERIQFYQTIKVSYEKANEELYSLIKISKEFVDKDTIKVNGITNIKKYQILSETTDSWVIRIDYNPIVGGGIVSIPITFQQRNYTTPPNSETKIFSTLYYKDNILATDSISVYANTVTPKLTKNVHSNYIHNGQVNIGLASKENSKFSSKNKSELNTILYEMIATIGTEEGNGIFINNNSKIVDTLSELIKFDENAEYANKWEYNEKDNTVIFKINKDSKIYHGSVQALLPVYFPNIEEGKSIFNTAELKNINNYTVSNSTTKFIPSIEPNEPYISGEVCKYAQGESYNRNIGEHPDDITWTVYPYISENPFNKKAYIKEIEDIVDENQYYTQFQISMPQNISFDFIDFYAAKEDGVYKLVQEKIPTDKDITVSSDYRKIKIIFRTPVSFDKNIKFYPKTKVKDKIWGSKMDGKRVVNTAKITYTDPEGKKLGDGSTYADVTYSSPKIAFYTTIEKGKEGLHKEVLGNINDVVNINYNVYFYNVPKDVEPTIVTILPSGVVPISEIKNGIIEKNYLGTGQTAILQKVTKRSYESFSSDIPVKLTRGLAKGRHIIQHYIYWENQNITPLTDHSYNQRYSYILKNNTIDFDSKGTFLGKDILADHDEIDYYPPLEVMIFKKIGTTPQNLSENPIEVSSNQDIYYEISLENRTNETIEDYYFYDILPFDGDKIFDQQSNRGSTANAIFSQIVSKDNNLDIYCSSENQINNINNFSWENIDSNTPRENIKTLKFVPTKKLEPNQVMKVLFKVNLNSNSENSIIRNSALLTQKNKNVLLDSNIVEAKGLKNETTEVKGIKTWLDNDNQDGKRPESITVNLLADGKQISTKEVRESDDWKYTFENLPKFKDGKEIVYTITENQVSEYKTEIKGFDITNSYTPEKTSVSVTKYWEDANNQDGKRPNSIQVQLLANGNKLGDPVELNDGNSWTTAWNDLDKKAKGQDIQYTVEEVAVPGYTTTIDATDKGNIKITNTHIPETTEVKGIKTWLDNDNQDGKRPESITVNLLADGKQISTKEVRESDDWKYTFENLPKFKDGKEIVYTITENQVSEYKTEIKGFDITNSYTPEKTSVSVTKYWEDANNQDGKRPNSIQVQLLANGNKLGDPVELNDGNSWTTAWNDLDKKAKGQDIQYTVEEVAVPGYTTTIDATDKGNIKITNTHIPETTEVKGIKTWLDNDNQDGKRPESITVNLLADGKQISTKEVRESDDWKYTFENLPKFKDGKEIVYTITENQVSEYKTEIKGFDITNSYTPEKTSVSVTKYWEDANNQDGKRPNSIQVQLLANGNKLGDPVELNDGNSWTTAWNDLDKKAKGQDIQYTVEEVAVPGYTTTIDATDKGNIKITNTYTFELIDKPDEQTKPSIKKILKKHLPKTGEKNTFWLTIIGILLICCISSYIYFRKKKTYKNITSK